MTENRQIDNEGNYNERIEGDYVQGRNNFLNNNFSLFGRLGSNEPLTSAKNSRIRQILLKQVDLEVEKRLESSLHNRVYITLDVEQNPEQIELPWASEIKVGNLPKTKLDNTDIINIFDQTEIAGRLLILGQPGAGKTTMLLLLASSLINRAKNNSSSSVPVLFSLSFWKKDQQNIKDWLVEQLKDKYGVRQDIGKQWVNNQEIIPLLDGLDELAAERQEKCVLKINEFLDPKTWNNPVIICSRIEEYQQYTTLLQLNNSLELFPFSPQQVYQYLQNTGNSQLWNSISNDADLSQLAKTPLLLNIIVLSAEEISIQTWQQFNSSEERLSYLFDAYIRRMFKRPYKDKKPKLENTQCWLNWLARQLIEESVTEFLIEKIQPDWLKNKVQKIIYNLIVWGIIGALINGLYSGLTSNVTSDVIDGLMSGLIYGLSYGLIVDFVENKINKKIILINPLKIISKDTISGLIIGLTHALIYGLCGGLYIGLHIGLYIKAIGGQPKSDFVFTFLIIFLIQTLTAGVIFGVIFGVIGNKILAIETLSFSLKKFLNGTIKGINKGIIYGLPSGIIFSLIFLATCLLIFGEINLQMIVFLVIILIIELIFVAFLVLIFGLISGINGLEVENTTFPNQGIQKSVINTIQLSITISLFASLIIFIVKIIIKYKIYHQVSIDGLGPGIFFGILIGISRSGIPAIKHFILRLILWSNGYAPWNYAKFLNYCTNRLFLQRVGGSYRFIHDLLRQHFAKSYTQMNLAPVQAIPVETSPPLVQNYQICTNCGHNNLANLNFCTKCGTKLNRPHI